MPRRDIDDFEAFEPDALAERQHQREEAIATAQKATQLDEEERAAKQKRVDDLSAKANESALIAEYRAAGIEPYRSPGGMLVSLAMLRKLGWTIGEIDGKPALMKPKESAHD